VNRNPGGMAMLKRMMERGLIADGAGKKSKPIKPPRRVEQAIAAWRKSTLRLQGRLKDEGFDPGRLDGLYGKRTEDALRAYNRRHHP
jgi:peptidoglycan hydrolase-like protein with peptidoglycan-binding domain